MHNLKVIIVSILVLSLGISCKKISNSGAVVSEERELSNFNSIASEISGDVFVTQDSTFSVTIEAGVNVLDILETSIDNNNELHIRLKNGKFVNSKNVKIYITMPKIIGLSIYGSGNIEMQNNINTTQLDLDTKGSGDIKLQELYTDNINATISGSGSVSSLSGIVKNEKIKVSGSGSIDFFNLKSSNSDIKISGSGDVKVYVTDNLTLKISGSGNVYYQGNPIIDADISGSGKLKHL